MRNPWKPIKTCRAKDCRRVDLWMAWRASFLTGPFNDSFRVVDAYRISGKWFHVHDGKQTELNKDYITHWMPRPRAPVGMPKEF